MLVCRDICVFAVQTPLLTVCGHFLHKSCNVDTRQLPPTCTVAVFVTTSYRISWDSPIQQRPKSSLNYFQLFWTLLFWFPSPPSDISWVGGVCKSLIWRIPSQSNHSTMVLHPSRVIMFFSAEVWGMPLST